MRSPRRRRYRTPAGFRLRKWGPPLPTGGPRECLYGAEAAAGAQIAVTVPVSPGAPKKTAIHPE
jgi:hypothetical protein